MKSDYNELNDFDKIADAYYSASHPQPSLGFRDNVISAIQKEEQRRTEKSTESRYAFLYGIAAVFSVLMGVGIWKWPAVRFLVDIHPATWGTVLMDSAFSLGLGFKGTIQSVFSTALSLISDHRLSSISPSLDILATSLAALIVVWIAINTYFVKTIKAN